MITAPALRARPPVDRSDPPAAGPLPARRAPRHLEPTPPASWPWLVLWCGWIGGAALLTRSYDRAIVATGTGYYSEFWAGMLLGTVPAAMYASSRRTRRPDRLWALLGLACFTMIPKFLLDPSAPLLHDELGHWREVQDILSTGRLHQPNSILPIISDYPGLHALTTMVRQLSGLSTWHSALILLTALHCGAVVVMFLVADRLAGARVGAVAAVFYALNSSYIYFDTEFGYESLSIVLFLVAVLSMIRVWQSSSRPEVRRWLSVGLLTGLACVVTHHLTSLILSLVLGALALLTRTHDADPAIRTSRRRAAVALSGSVAIGLVLWIALAAPFTVGYLSPYAAHGAQELGRILGGGQQGKRTLFAHNPGPSYEHIAGLASPFLVLGMWAAGAWIALRQRVLNGPAVPLACFGLLYFVSLPFTLTLSGAEGAHRSWAFTYAGVALLVAVAAVRMLRRAETWVGPMRWAPPAFLVAVFVAVLVGNVSAGQNADYRFPGPYEFGSDTRSVTPELRDLGAWLQHYAGVHRGVVTDRYTGLILASFGDQHTAVPSAGFPTYDLYFSDGPPSARLLRELRTSGFEYLVVDKRDGTQLPALGVYFEPDEPFAYSSVAPITPAKLSRYDDLPWTEKVFESDHYAVYRFDFAAYGAPLAASAGR